MRRTRFLVLLWLTVVLVVSAALPPLALANRCFGKCPDTGSGGASYDGCAIYTNANDEIYCAKCGYSSWVGDYFVLEVIEWGDCSGTPEDGLQ